MDTSIQDASGRTRLRSSATRREFNVNARSRAGCVHATCAGMTVYCLRFGQRGQNAGVQAVTNDVSSDPAQVRQVVAQAFLARGVALQFQAF